MADNLGLCPCQLSCVTAGAGSRTPNLQAVPPHEWQIGQDELVPLHRDFDRLELILAKIRCNPSGYAPRALVVAFRLCSTGQNHCAEVLVGIQRLEEGDFLHLPLNALVALLDGATPSHSGCLTSPIMATRRGTKTSRSDSAAAAMSLNRTCFWLRHGDLVTAPGANAVGEKGRSPGQDRNRVRK